MDTHNQMLIYKPMKEIQNFDNILDIHQYVNNDIMILETRPRDNIKKNKTIN